MKSFGFPARSCLAQFWDMGRLQRKKNPKIPTFLQQLLLSTVIIHCFRFSPSPNSSVLTGGSLMPSPHPIHKTDSVVLFFPFPFFKILFKKPSVQY